MILLDNESIDQIKTYPDFYYERLNPIIDRYTNKNQHAKIIVIQKCLHTFRRFAISYQVLLMIYEGSGSKNSKIKGYSPLSYDTDNGD